MSLFAILNVGANAMASSSFGVNVASQNSSNVGTAGYTRRSARLEPVGGPPAGGGGSRAVGARRIIDGFVERRLLGARAGAGASAERAKALSVLDSVAADETGGIGESLGALHRALADLSAHPSDTSARTMVLGGVEGLARAFNRARGMLSEAQSAANDRIADKVSELNGKLREIARLGSQISKNEVRGVEASDLRDRRDQLVREVSDAVPVTVRDEPNGQLSLALAGGVSLVSANGKANELSAVGDAVSGDLHVFGSAAGIRQDVTSSLNGGALGGLIQARDGAMSEVARSLDQLAYDVANGYNAVHAAGVGLDGSSGLGLFERIDSVDGAAAAIAISSSLDDHPERVAAAIDGSLLPGDNRGALALVGLSDQNIASGGTRTASDGLAALMGQAGAALQAAETEDDHASAAAAQVAALREQVSGVSLDEEMMQMQRFQRAYQASLRVISVADEMLQDLMNLRS